jgi:hypothetical protein
VNRVLLFLMGLSAKDCSLMLTLAPADLDNSTYATHGPLSVTSPSQSVTTVTTTRGAVFHVAIAAVDLDFKRPGKIEKYLAAEAEMLRIQREMPAPPCHP